MKYLHILLFCFLFSSLSATDYYFSVTGDDGNTGLTSGSPWQTNAKMQGLADTVSAGTTIYLKRGDTWDEFTLSIIDRIGTYNSRITIDAYGTGDGPILDLSKALGTWSFVSGNIWTITDTDIKSGTRNEVYYDGTSAPYYRPWGQLIMDGTAYKCGREPNSGYLESTSLISSLNTNVGGVSWTPGAYDDGLAKIAKGQYTNFYQEPADINANGTSNVSIWNSGFWYGTVPPTYTTKFFMMNGLGMLNQDGEWRLYEQQIWVYSATDPNLRSTRFSVQDSGIYVSGSAYVDIKNIQVRRGHRYNIKLEDNVGTIRTENINHTEAGLFAMHADGNLDSVIIYQDTVQNIANAGYWITDQDVYLSIKNSYFDEIGVDPVGANSRRETGGCAVALEFSNCEFYFQYNYIDSVGYNGLQLVGNNETGGLTKREISYNLIKNYCEIISDGGAIYMIRDTLIGEDKHIHHNILVNGGRTNDYVANNASATALAAGIYGDESCRALKIDYNYSNNSQFGVFFNGNQRDTVRANVFRNVEYSTNRSNYGKGMQQTAWLGYDQEHVSMTSNYFVTIDSLSSGANVNDLSSDIDTHNSLMDSNHYFNPYYLSQASAETNWAYFNDQVNYSNNYKTIGTIRSSYGWENNGDMNANSWAFSSGWGLTVDQATPFAYNWSADDYEIDLLSTVVRDLDGNQHSGTVTLSPYTGHVYFYESGSTANFLNVDWDYEAGGAATPPTPPVADTCDFHITLYDTVTVSDSSLFLFENDYTDEYSNTTITNYGTTFETAFECEGTYGLDADFTPKYLTFSSTDLSDSIDVSFCFTNWSTYGVLFSNRTGSGDSGFSLRRQGSVLHFITENGSGNIDSASTLSVVPTGSIEIDVRASKTYGVAQIFIDGVDQTGSNNTIRTDFNTDGIMALSANTDGSDLNYGYYDSLLIKWNGTDITERDSCVQITDTISASDTLFVYNADFVSFTDNRYYDGVCGDTLMIFDQGDYISFKNVNFGSQDNFDIRMILPSAGSEFEVRSDSVDGTLIANTSAATPGAGCQTLTVETSILNGVKDIYMINSGSVDNIELAWVYFFKGVRTSKRIDLTDRHAKIIIGSKIYEPTIP